MKTIREWLQSGEYLPAPLRDFHDQKDIFKAIWEVVMRAKERQEKERSGIPYLGGLNWVDAHIFTIDQFLYFMARHGWTLQRSRKPYEFTDIEDTVAERRARETAALKAWLAANTSSAVDEQKP